MTRAATKADFDGTPFSDQHVPALVQQAILDQTNGVAPEQLAPGDTNLKWKKIAVGTGTSAEVDSLWDLPAKSIVSQVLIEVVTPEATGATKTLDVGLLASESGGDADGFLDGVSVAAAGVFGGEVTITSSVYASTTRGVLMSTFVAGTNADDRGLFQAKNHGTSLVTSKSVSYSRGSTFVEFAGFIWIGYTTFVG